MASVAASAAAQHCNTVLLLLWRLLLTGQLQAMIELCYGLCLPHAL
jgi:hypothetical protein